MAKFDNHMVFRILLIVLAAFVLFALVSYYNSKQTSNKTEKFYNEEQETPLLETEDDEDVQFAERFTNPAAAAPAAPAVPGSSVKPSEELGDETYRTVDFDSQKLPGDCFPKDRLTADDLLPKDAANSKWSQVATNGQGELANQNFLTSGYHVGINSISGSLRNANQQIRSEPPNPRISGISPWMQSTITGNSMARGFEIGSDC